MRNTVLKDSTGNSRKICEKGAIIKETEFKVREKAYNLAQSRRNINMVQREETWGEAQMRGDSSLKRTGAD